MPEDSTITKIFISYSWNPESNKERVSDLAKRLVNDGIHVVIDIWDLSPGQDKYHFMERMVNDSTISKVLVICNSDYKAKADARAKGVGIESLIISPEIYKEADQKKFIPVLFEKDESGKDYKPTYLTSRIHIDLSDDETFETYYEQLLRHILNKPQFERPPLGKQPDYLNDQKPIFIPVRHKVPAIIRALRDGKRNTNSLIKEYYKDFRKCVEGLANKDDDVMDTPLDEFVVQKIEFLTPLRDDFITFLEGYVNLADDILVDPLISFYNRLLQFLFDLDYTSTSKHGARINDHLFYFVYELFLYNVLTFLENERFADLRALLASSFLITRDPDGHPTSFNFPVFRKYLYSLEEGRKARLSLLFKSVTGNLVKQRVPDRYTFQNVQQCDALLYYISIMTLPPSRYQPNMWIPLTAAGGIYSIAFLNKMISKKFFNESAILFNVKTVDELRLSIQIATDVDKLERMDYTIPLVANAFNIERICTLP